MNRAQAPAIGPFQVKESEIRERAKKERKIERREAVGEKRKKRK